MRLGNFDAFKENWDENSAIGKTMRLVIDGMPTIDPETMPVVQQLRAELERLEKSCETCRDRTRKLLKDARETSDELEKVKAERDAAVKDLRGCAIESYAECMYCSHNNKGTLCWNCTNGSNWEWRGVGR